MPLHWPQPLKLHRRIVVSTCFFVSWLVLLSTWNTVLALLGKTAWHLVILCQRSWEHSPTMSQRFTRHWHVCVIAGQRRRRKKRICPWSKQQWSDKAMTSLVDSGMLLLSLDKCSQVTRCQMSTTCFTYYRTLPVATAEAEQVSLKVERTANSSTRVHMHVSEEHWRRLRRCIGTVIGLQAWIN